MNMLQSLEAIKKVLVYLFGPGRFFLYFVGVMWIFRRQLTNTIMFNQIQNKVMDFLFWYEYRTTDKELISFINEYYDNYIYSLVKVEKNYRKARDARRKKRRGKYEELCEDILYYFPAVHYNDNYMD